MLLNRPPNPLKGELGTKKPSVTNTAEKKFYISLRAQAQRMKHNPTKAEAILWQELSNKKLGIKFRRQHIINRFIVDFYCIEKALVIEIDGNVHDTQQVRDYERGKLLQSLGCIIIRFRNEEVLFNLTSVIRKIRKTCANIYPL